MAHARASPYGGGGDNFKTVQCQFFMEGRCTKGEACTFLHGDEGDESAGYGKAGGKSCGKCKGGSKGAAAAPWHKGAAAATSSPWGGGGGAVGGGSNYKTVPCEFFAKGMCTKGEACTFLHGNEGMASGGKGVAAPWHKGASAVSAPYSGGGGSNFKTVPCEFFAKGTCTKGEACTFLHGNEGMAPKGKAGGKGKPTPSSKFGPSGAYSAMMAVGDKKTVPCIKFLQGQCSKGAACNFLHEEGGQQAPQDNYKTVPCRFFQEGKCTKGDQCSYSHGEEGYVAPVHYAAPYAPYPKGGKGAAGGGGGNFKTVQCEFFAKGTCTKGEACTFLHGDEGSSYGKSYGKATPSYGGKGGPIVLPGAYINGAFKGDAKGGKSGNFKTVQCEFFAKGLCTRGDACTFLHGEETESESFGGKGGSSSNFKTVQCAFFAKGTCTKGEACSFLHGTDGMSEIEALAYELSQPAHQPAQALSGKKGGGKKGGGSNFKTVECEFFKQGRCTKGDACSFLHPGIDQQDAEAEPRLDPDEEAELAALEWELSQAADVDEGDLE